MASPNAVIAEILRMLRRFMMFSFGLEMDYKHDSDGRLMDGLLVIADAAAQVAYPGNEAYLGNQWCGRARLWKHVAAWLGDLTFRLLCRGIDFLTNLLTCRRVLEDSLVGAYGDRNWTGNLLSIPDSEAERIQIAVPKPALPLVEHSQCQVSVRLHGGSRLQEHGLGFIGCAELALCESHWCERNDCDRRRSGYECTDHAFFLPVRTSRTRKRD